MAHPSARCSASSPVLVIHGGAGTIERSLLTKELEREFRSTLEAVLSCGRASLLAGASSVDVVAAAVCALEDTPLFNAGYGAVFTSERRHELDACIADGWSGSVGAVAGTSTSRNPILAARAVMEYSGHVMMAGPGVDSFAAAHGVAQVANEYFSTAHRLAQLDSAQAAGVVVLDHSAAASQASAARMGTVGAVALDAAGHLAAATSTGGMTNKRPGRVGDTPIYGAGAFADRTCAVSCTGTGEAFIRACAAFDVSARMRYGGASLQDAAAAVIFERVAEAGGEGGLIAVSSAGEIAMPFSTPGMYRGFARVADAAIEVAIFRD